MYEFLTKDRSVPKQFVQDISLKIDKLKDQLYKLFDTRKNGTNSKITFDISQLTNSFNFDEVEKIRDSLFEFLNKILAAKGLKRLIGTEFIYDDVIIWVNSLISKINIYKWSQFIDYHDIFAPLADKLYRIPYFRISSKIILQFVSLVQECQKRLDIEEYSNMINALVLALNRLEYDDDLPF